MSNEDLSIPTITDEKVLLAIRKSLGEIQDANLRISAERAFIKDEISAICEKHQIPKKVYRKVVKAYLKNNLAEEAKALESTETLYEQIFGRKKD